MKILYLARIRLPSPKAHTIQIMKACEALTQLGNSVELVIPSWKPRIFEPPLQFYGIQTPFKITKVPTFFIPFSGDIFYFLHSYSFAIFALLKKRTKNYNVIYCRDEAVLATVIFIRRFCRRKISIVWESHDGAASRTAIFVARNVDFLVVVSRAARQFYIAQGIPGDRILALPNGVDVVSFGKPASRQEACRELGFPEDRKIALYVGRVGSWRGTETLLKAEQFLPPSVVVAVVGGGESYEACKAAFPRVLFRKHYPYRNLPTLLASADILIIPNTARHHVSLSFTSPLKLFAYMAVGKPIVASDIPSLRELATDMEVLFVPPDSPEELAKGIVWLLDHPDEASSLGNRARERAKGYDWVFRAQKLVTFISQKRGAS